jgi:16S rRNA (guanine527-N7)-methyltransferase
MTSTPELISSRLEASNLAAPVELVEKLTTYLETLARWNRRLNLTALSVDPPSAASIDRVIVEPVAAASEVASSDQVLIDVGSGGGSPAVPLRLASPWLRLVMVESKVRKAAFLRELLRELDLESTCEVQQKPFRDLAADSSFSLVADLVSIRAVRLDRELLVNFASVLKESGRIFQFAGPEGATGLRGFEITTTRSLVVGGQAQLWILRKYQ